MQNITNNQKGFTLIELIMVIIILGVLSAFALPRFADFRNSAVIATLDGLEGAMKSGSAIIRAQALVEGKSSGTQTIDSEGATITIVEGYASGNFVLGFRYIVNLDNINFSNPTDVCQTEWCGRGNQTSIPGGPSTSGLGGKIWPKGYRWSDQCSIFYVNHEDGRPPEIGQLTSGC